MVNTSVLAFFVFIYAIYIARSCNAFSFDSKFDADDVYFILRAFMRF